MNENACKIAYELNFYINANYREVIEFILDKDNAKIVSYLSPSAVEFYTFACYPSIVTFSIIENGICFEALHKEYPSWECFRSPSLTRHSFNLSLRTFEKYLMIIKLKKERRIKNEKEDMEWLEQLVKNDKIQIGSIVNVEKNEKKLSFLAKIKKNLFND